MFIMFIMFIITITITIIIIIIINLSSYCHHIIIILSSFSSSSIAIVTYSNHVLPALQVSHPKVPKHACQVRTAAAQFTNPQGFLKRSTWAWLGPYMPIRMVHLAF